MNKKDFDNEAFQKFWEAQQKTDQTFLDEIEELKKEIEHLKKSKITTVRASTLYISNLCFYDGYGDAQYPIDRISHYEPDGVWMYIDLIFE